jgi:hypothetical protein
MNIRKAFKPVRNIPFQKPQYIYNFKETRASLLNIDYESSKREVRLLYNLYSQPWGSNSNGILFSVKKKDLADKTPARQKRFLLLYFI